MKKLFNALTIAALFASCSKDKNPAPSAPKEKKLVEETNINVASDWTKYQYDATGRLAKVETDTRFTTYGYQPSKVSTADYLKSNGQVSSRKECVLDASGHCITRYYIQPSGDTLFFEQFEYDGDGFIKKIETKYKSGEQWLSKYTMEAGNIVEDVTYQNGVLSDSTRYYYNGVATKSGFNTVTDDPAGKLYGACSKNVMTGFKRYNGAGQLTFHRENVIEVDADGYMTKVTMKNMVSGASNTWVYKYE